MEKVPDTVFKDVTYYIIGNIDEKIEDILNAGGGKRDHYLSETIKYVIVDDPSDAEYSEAKELFELPVVTSRWVILSARCGCLLPTNAFKPEEDQVFSGLTVCSSQLTEADTKALWSLVTFNGGSFQLPFNNNVTHLVTTQTKGVKYDAASQHVDSVETVTPDWVSDCIEHKTLLDASGYHPRLLTDGSTLYDLPSLMPEYPATPTEADMMACGDDNIKDSPKSAKTKEALARMVSSRIIMAGWKAPELEPLPPAPPPAVLLTPSPMLPAQQVSPAKSARGSMSGSTRGMGSPRGVRGMGSTRGIMRNITNGMPLRGRGSRGPRSPRSPRARSPRGSLKGMSHLIGGLGGHPGMMSPGAFLAGQQPFPFGSLPPVPTGPLFFGHDPAESVPDDICLLGCVFYITDYQKYLEKDVLEMWKTVIQQHGGEVDDTYSNRVTHIMCEHQQSDVFQLALRDNKRLVTAHWLNDVLLIKKMQPPWKAIHIPNVYGNDKPCSNHVISVTNFEGDDRTLLKHMILLIGAKYTGYMTHSNSVLICKKPEGTKYQKALEWQIPVVNVQWLQEILLGDLSPLKLPVQPKYQNYSDNPFFLDLLRVVRFMDGWKVPVRIHKEWKKFHASQALKLSGNTTPGKEGGEQGVKRAAEDVQQSEAKRLRQDENTPPEQLQSNGKPCVLITGVTKAKASQLEQEVANLGGKVVTSSRHCTHLVANSVSRTVKFLSSFSVAGHCVTTEWVEESAKQGHFLDELSFSLKDERAEKMYDFSIAAALEKASQRKLFKDMLFYLTPSVVPGRSTLREILNNAGGVLVDKQPSIKELRTKINEIGQPTFIVISCEEDLRLCKDLTKRKIGVQNAEFILTGVIKQELDFESYRIN